MIERRRRAWGPWDVVSKMKPEAWSGRDSLLLVFLEHPVSEQLHTSENLGNVVGGLSLKDDPLQTTHTLGDHVQVVLEGRGTVRVLDFGNGAHLLLKVLDEFGESWRGHVGLLGLVGDDEIVALSSECA